MTTLRDLNACNMESRIGSTIQKEWDKNPQEAFWLVGRAHSHGNMPRRELIRITLLMIDDVIKLAPKESQECISELWKWVNGDDSVDLEKVRDAAAYDAAVAAYAAARAAVATYDAAVAAYAAADAAYDAAVAAYAAARAAVATYDAAVAAYAAARAAVAAYDADAAAEAASYAVADAYVTYDADAAYLNNHKKIYSITTCEEICKYFPNMDKEKEIV